MDIEKNSIFRHYKGQEYKVIEQAINSENKEEVVVYQSIDDEKNIWVRPKKMFLSEVEVDGKKIPRFEFLKIDETDSAEHRYLRALADYQNLLKQSAKDKEDFVKYAVSDFLHDLLPIYDHLKLALVGLKEQDSKSPWAVGVNHVLKQFKEVLTSRGIEEISTVGLKFDHNVMEAVSGSGEIVKQEISPGYKLNGRIIRPAKVIVED